MSRYNDYKTIHTCKICRLTEQCKNEMEYGTCDFRELNQAHGYCQANLTVKERVLFYGKDDIYIVEKEKCSQCGNGFTLNTFCKQCVETAKK